MKNDLKIRCAFIFILTAFLTHCGSFGGGNQKDIQSSLNDKGKAPKPPKPPKPITVAKKSCTVQGYHVDHVKYVRKAVAGARSTKTATASGIKKNGLWTSAEAVACKKACDIAMRSVCAYPSVEVFAVVGGCNEAYYHGSYVDCR